MKTLVSIFLILLVSFACSEDDPDPITKDGDFPISELAGTYLATQAQFSVGGTSVDIVDAGGTVSMSIQSSGRFTATLDPIDRAAYTVSGEMFWEEWQNTFYFAIRWDDEPDDWDTYGHTWDGTTLSLNGGQDTGSYDFDNDGDEESCSMHFILVRD
jgi:hypothetical protein